MEQVVLDAKSRTPGGKIEARKARNAGLVPGVVYGRGQEVLSLSVDARNLWNVLRHQRGGNVLFSLNVDGETPEGLAAIIKELQTDPVTDEFLAVDFQWVSLTEKVTVQVAVRFVGVSEGALVGGSVDQILYDVPIACLPLEIPEEFTLDITGMEIGDTRHVSDLIFPEGVDFDLLIEPDEAMVTVRAPVVIEEPEVEDEEGLEGEEGEEGEEGAEGAEGEDGAEPTEDAEGGDEDQGRSRS